MIWVSTNRPFSRTLEVKKLQNPAAMKRPLTILSLILSICEIVSAQTSYPEAIHKGSVLTGGSATINFIDVVRETSDQGNGNNEKEKYTSFSFTPKAGFFFANGLAVGLTADLTTLTWQGDSKSTASQFSLGPMVRFYTADGFFLSADFMIGKYIERHSGSLGSETDQTDLTLWQLGAGYAFFLNEYVSVEPSITYRKTAASRKVDQTDSKANISELMFGVGFNIFLHRKRNY
jgi:hypothetical protein